MTVKELRAALFLIREQEAEVRFMDPLNATVMSVASVWVTDATALDVPSDADPIYFDTTVPPTCIYLSWVEPK